MNKKTLNKLYFFLSWILIAATCVVTFVMKEATLSMLGLMLAIVFRYLAQKAECDILKQENTELEDDMRRLTKILEETSNAKNENN